MLLMELAILLPVLRHAAFFVTAITKEYYNQFKLAVTSFLQQNSARVVMKSETNKKFAKYDIKNF